MKLTGLKMNLKVWGKAAAFTSLTIFMTIGLVHANLDAQITKVSDIVLGNFAALIIGGGMVVGGGFSCYQGDIPKGFAQLAVGAMIGIGTALAKSQAIFNVLN